MGRRKDSPRVYWITPGEEQCVIGCFRGNLDELEAAVRKTHVNNPQHLRDYLKWISAVRAYQQSML
jgi:hypothetical protein